jgi:hypothetical protein
MSNYSSVEIIQTDYITYIKKKEFKTLLDNQLFENQLINLSIHPDNELFNDLKKRQIEFTTNIEDLVTKNLFTVPNLR